MKLDDHLSASLADLKQQGLYKRERIITSRQAGEIELAGGELGVI
jgi:glycine C-acetyltransferase